MLNWCLKFMNNFNSIHISKIYNNSNKEFNKTDISKMLWTITGLMQNFLKRKLF